ncbi:MAG: hypothetical protein QOF21_1617 [Actinomycetota bacterium]|jgi:hypothetical protein
MKFRIHRLVAVVSAVALIAPVAAALADTVPVPATPPVTVPALPLPITIPPLPAVPPITYPNPAATLAMLQGQIDLIANALKTTPQELLNTVLASEIPSEGSLVTTVNDLLNRLAGTKIFDAKSNGILGTTEIAIGNISHGYSMGGIAKPAIDGPKCAPATPSNPCPTAPNPWAATLPAYSKVTSDWLPTTPAQSVLGTSIILPLVNGLSPALPVGLPAAPPWTGVTPGDVPANVCTTAPLPVYCQAVSALIKTNLILVDTKGGKLVNVQASGLELPDATTGVMVKKGVHNGGTGALNGSNLDTAYRVPKQADPSPVYLPLLTSTAALADNGIDFLGFSPANPSSTRSCTNNKDSAGKTIPTTYTPNPDGTETAHFPASTCSAAGAFAGFGIAVYNDHAPVNFRTDLAPLWDPPPNAVAAVANAAAAVVATLSPYLPAAGLGLLADPRVTFALGLAGVATNLQGQILAAAGGVPEVPAVPAIPTGLPPSLPALPVALPTLP